MMGTLKQKGQKIRGWFLSPGRAVDSGEMTQWQLIRRRFRRHRLAVLFLNILFVLYFLAAFAEFFAPYPKLAKNVDYPYAPPQLPRFNFEHGWHTPALELERDPATLRAYYDRLPGAVVPLSFFVRGESYKMFGLFEWDRRFFGVDQRGVDAGKISPERATFFFMGTDAYGQDILSRIIFGSRISLSIGLLSVFIILILGIVIGGVSGYVGGGVDEGIQRLIEVIRSLPQIPLWIALGAIIPAEWPLVLTYLGITVVLSLLGWTNLARVVRGKILSLREEDYAVAARLLGASHRRILFRHLMPGFTSHIIITMTLRIPQMILGETALSFLGLGLRSPVVSWGVMLQDAMEMQVVANYPWLLMPVVAIVVAVLSFNFVGDGMRDAADPYG